MPAPVQPPEPPTLAFCPFCRDGFEGLAECPEHELTLVPIDRLPRPGERGVSEVTFFADPRLGRGGVLLGAALVLVGFLMPFVRARGIAASALEVAIEGAYNLWLIPGAACGVLAVLWARRTATAMRAARLAAVGLALAGALPLVYTVRRIELVAGWSGTEVHWLSGLGVMLAGLVFTALLGVRLGGSARRGV
jgi:hypothetical protein